MSGYCVCGHSLGEHTPGGPCIGRRNLCSCRAFVRNSGKPKPTKALKGVTPLVATPVPEDPAGYHGSVLDIGQVVVNPAVALWVERLAEREECSGTEVVANIVTHAWKAARDRGDA